MTSTVCDEKRVLYAGLLRPEGDGPAAELAQLRARNVELEEALRARDRFIATLSHELRNPLSPILLQIQSISDVVLAADAGVVRSDQLRPRLEAFTERLHRFLDALDRVLDAASIRRGGLELRLEEVDLADLVRAACAARQRELTAAQCSLILSVPRQLVGRWDRARVGQIVGNLLSNAMRYGAGRPIEVTLLDEGPEARLEVRDYGIGIPEDMQAELFQRFDRVTMRNSAGLGIGLWIVHQLSRAMHARVEVHSEHGRGSSFTVVLPRQR